MNSQLKIRITSPHFVSFKEIFQSLNILLMHFSNLAVGVLSRKQKLVLAKLSETNQGIEYFHCHCALLRAWKETFSRYQKIS